VAAKADSSKTERFRIDTPPLTAAAGVPFAPTRNTVNLSLF
jgi:hypothetical protein